MASVYQCDACGDIMVCPHSAKMKEFYVGCSYEFDMVLPSLSTRTKKIHLCDKCYKGLKNLAEQVSDK